MIMYAPAVTFGSDVTTLRDVRIYSIQYPLFVTIGQFFAILIPSGFREKIATKQNSCQVSLKNEKFEIAEELRKIKKKLTWA